MYDFCHLLLLKIKLLLKNSMNLFWIFLFPILLLVILMLAFGNNDKAILGEVNIFIEDQDKTHSSNTYITSIKETLAANTYIKFNWHKKIATNKSKIDKHNWQLLIPQGFADVRTKVKPVYLEYKVSQNTQAFLGAFLAANDRANIELIDMPFHQLKFKEHAADKKQLSYGQYLVTGLIGMNLLSIVLFSFCFILISDRESGVLKMYQLLPIAKISYLLSFSVARIIVLFIFTWGFLIFGNLSYNLQINFSVYSIIHASILILFSSITFLMFGMMIASFIYKTSTAMSVINLVYFPVMFLSDLFIPTTAMPEVLKQIVNLFPLNGMVDSLRNILFYNQGILDNWQVLLNLCIWLLVGIFVSNKWFKWYKV